MPWLEIEVTTEEMSHLREGRRSGVRVHGRDDERPRAHGLEVTVTECEMWRFRRLCNTKFFSVCAVSGKSRPGSGCRKRRLIYDLA